MRKVLVMGIGNRLMMDDGIGVYLAESLKAENSADNLRYVVGETDVNYCLDQLADEEFVIILDSAYFGLEPCAVSALPLPLVRSVKGLALSPHEEDFMQVLMREHRIRNAAEPLNGMLIGIEACIVDYGFGLSCKMRQEFPQILSQVRDVIHMAVKGLKI